MEKSNSIRNSVIELLRIFSMFLIIMSHYSVHGATNVVTTYSFNTVILEICSQGGLGVCIFMMISGYYLISSTKTKPFKVIRLVLEVLFYSVSLYFISIGLGVISFSWTDLLKNIFSIVFTKHWFISAYIVIYIFHPFINKLLNNLGNKEYLIMLILMFIFWSVIPLVSATNFGLSDILFLFIIYAIGGFINRLQKQEHKFVTTKNGLLLAGIGSAVIVIFTVGIGLIGHFWVKELNHYSTLGLSTKNSPVVIITALGYLLIGITVKPFCSKTINFLSSFILGVYLIHDNEYFRQFLFSPKAFNVPYYASTNLLIPHMIGCSLAILFGCILIDCLRTNLLEKPLFYFIDKIKFTKKGPME